MANYPEFSAFYSLYLLGLQGRRVDVRLDVAVAQNREYGGIKKMDDRWIGLWFHKFQSTDGRDERIARNGGRAIERGRITVDMEDRSQTAVMSGQQIVCGLDVEPIQNFWRTHTVTIMGWDRHEKERWRGQRVGVTR